MENKETGTNKDAKAINRQQYKDDCDAEHEKQQSELDAKKFQEAMKWHHTSHFLHFIISILTIGGWGFMWALITINNNIKNNTYVTYKNNNWRNKDGK
jgi:hypothetical protein